MKRLALLLLLLGSFVGSTAIAGDSPTSTVYKVVGPDGKVSYSQRPPAEGTKSETMTFRSLPASPLSPATLAYIEELKNAKPAVAVESSQLVLFTRAGCGYCIKAKAYLSAKRIGYQEVDVETRDGSLAYVQAGGQGGVPLLVGAGKRVRGFSTGGYDNAFN